MNGWRFVLQLCGNRCSILPTHRQDTSRESVFTSKNRTALDGD
jgi:hypothetical protein